MTKREYSKIRSLTNLGHLFTILNCIVLVWCMANQTWTIQTLLAQGSLWWASSLFHKIASNKIENHGK